MRNQNLSRLCRRKDFFRVQALELADVLVKYALFEMQTYLTNVWGLWFTDAAAILNIWNGIYRILSLFFLYLVDTFLGNFKMLVVASIASTAGMVLVAMSTPPILANSTHTCKDYNPECIGHTQKGLFYLGMALVAVGLAGNIASVRPFLLEQREEENTDNGGSEAAPKSYVYKVLGLIGVVVVGIAGVIGLEYIKPWALLFGIPAIFSVVCTILFLCGSCSYNKDPLIDTSPVWNVCRVLVAAVLNIFKSYPDNPRSYHEMDEKGFSKTSCLRGLHKAAIVFPGDQENTRVRPRWTLCSVAQVEEAKIAVRMAPMWMTFVACTIVSSAGDTFFVEQADKLNRNIGKLRVPIQLLLLAQMLTEKLSNIIIVALLKKIKHYGAPSYGIAATMICSILCCVTAALVEIKRLHVARSHGLLDKPDERIPMSIFWLLFQFVLLGCLDSFFEKSVGAYYRDQSPSSMVNYLKTFAMGVSGLGFMCSGLLVFVVMKIKPDWVNHTGMNRFDRYFWMLAVLSAVNLIVFVIVAIRYRYRKPDEQGMDEDGGGGDGSFN